MDELGRYLRDSFYGQKRQVEEIGQLVGEVFPIFLNFWNDEEKTWPYELKDQEEPKSRGYSYSTTAMILFALASVVGDARETVLLPALRRAPAFGAVVGRAEIEESAVRKKLDAGVSCLEEK